MELEVAWAAGLIEGEGCFCLVKNYKAKGGKTAKICVQMNDVDVLERLQSVFDVGKIYYRPPRANSRESWAWTVYRMDDVKLIIEQTYNWLGSRRRTKADELMEWIRGGT